MTRISEAETENIHLPARLLETSLIIPFHLGRNDSHQCKAILENSDILLKY